MVCKTPFVALCIFDVSPYRLAILTSQRTTVELILLKFELKATTFYSNAFTKCRLFEHSETIFDDVPMELRFSILSSE